MKFESILEWYKGKSHSIIVCFVIPTLARCAELGYWEKGVSRKVKAALNKMNVAAKWARNVEKEFGEYSFGSVSMPTKHPLYESTFCMRYGQFERAPRTLEALLSARFDHKLKVEPFAKDAIRWAKAFAPVAELVTLLDSRRPKPVIVMKSLSPTVMRNISQHIGIDVATIQSPPSHSEWVKRTMKVNGRMEEVEVQLIVIDWPAGTKHNASRYHSTDRNMQCQACGHAIQNPYNWVPLLAYGHAEKPYIMPGTPFALWVGRDCASKLFDCEVTGDAIYTPESRP